MSVAKDAMDCLLEYHYPGNVRELKNIIERASILAPEPQIQLGDLPSDLSRQVDDEGSRSLNLSKVVAEIEKETILKALVRSANSRTKAADLLGISRKNLWEKMKSYNISV
jgi:two-component system response regulator AtoC